MVACINGIEAGLAGIGKIFKVDKNRKMLP